jgi:hypothetical protein
MKILKKTLSKKYFYFLSFSANKMAAGLLFKKKNCSGLGKQLN